MIKSKNKILSNFIYNFLYYVVILVLPIFTIPYISRVLLDYGIGQYNFCISFSNIVTLVANLGTSLYAQNLMSNKSTSEERTKLFLEITLIKLVSYTFISIVYFSVIQISYFDSYRLFLIISFLLTLGSFFDISWFYLAIENVRINVFANLLVKIIAFVSVFIFVKKESDLPLYLIIQCGSVFVGSILTWTFLPRYLSRKLSGKLSLVPHIKPILQLFIPVIASQIYPLLDKTMITFITGSDSQTGWYSQSDTIMRIGLTLSASALTSVTMPRVCQLFNSNENKAAYNLIDFNLHVLFLISFFLVPLILSCSDEFVVLFLGSSFYPSANILRILSPLIVIMGISNICGLLYFSSQGRNAVLTNVVLVSFVINISLNVVLTLLFGAYGTALASVIAELVQTIIFCYLIHKEYDFLKSFIDIYKYLFGSVFITGFCLLMKLADIPNFVYLSICGLGSLFIYLLFSFLVKEKVCQVFLKKVFRKNEN